MTKQKILWAFIALMTGVSFAHAHKGQGSFHSPFDISHLLTPLGICLLITSFASFWAICKLKNKFINKES